MKYATVVFDLDGTLVDTRPSIEGALRFALEAMRAPSPAPEQIRAALGPPLHQSFVRVFGMDDAEAAEAVAQYRVYYNERGVYEAEPYPGIIELIRALKDEGAMLAVATLKPLVYAERILEHIGLLGCFSSVCGPSLAQTSDVKAEMLALAVLGAPLPAIMIGDRAGDLLAAREVGVDSAGALYGYGSREELSACFPTYVAEDVSGLSRWLLHTR